MDAWLHEVNESLLLLGFFALLMAAAQAGDRIARTQPGGREASSIAPVQGALFGLLALLLAFTFSLAMTRFDTRKEMVRDEANAIGTTYLRAQLLPEPMRSRVPALLRSYVDSRFELRRVGYLPDRLREVNQRSTALHDRIWGEAVAAARVDPDSKMTALFIVSLNEMIDLHGKHVAAIRNDMPAWLIMLLFVVAIVALGLTGYGASPSPVQSFILNTLVAAVISAVTMLIFDLHRPSRGFINIDMASMEDLRQSMDASAP